MSAQNMVREEVFTVPVSRETFYKLLSRFAEHSKAWEVSTSFGALYASYITQVEQQQFLSKKVITVTLDHGIMLTYVNRYWCSVHIYVSARNEQEASLVDGSIQYLVTFLRSMAQDLGGDAAAQANEVANIKLAETIPYIRAQVAASPQSADLHYKLAVELLSTLFPEIEDEDFLPWRQTLVWEPYDPLLAEASSELNIALALGLNSSLDAAKASRLQMLLILSRESSSNQRSNRERGWHVPYFDRIRNDVRLKALAHDIVTSAKNHLRRNPYSMISLYLQESAFYFLGDKAGLGQVEQAITRLNELRKAGLIDTHQSSSSAVNRMTSRNDGLNLERQVKDLLVAMGLTATTTQLSGDGGIDVLAYSEAPIFSGKYVVQCKDWSNPVGESVVRDLYGVVMSERANKGVLIATGGFTEPAKAFAADKPIELVDGQQLQMLMNKYDISS